MVLRRVFQAVLAVRSAVLAVADAVRRAKAARDEAGEHIARAEANGGVVLPCGCFIQVRADDLRFVMAQTSPQELNRLVRALCRDDQHGCPARP